MARPRVLAGRVLAGPAVTILLLCGTGNPTPAQNAAAQPATRPETILRALAADPITAPYAFSATEQDGRVVLSGRVGSRLIYDAAIRDVIATGIPFLDRLTIDTAESYRSIPPPSSGLVPTGPIPGVSYPPALPWFGFWPDPFYGINPPEIAYPPWWGPLSAARLGPIRPAVPAAAAAAKPLPPYWVEMSIDPLGYGVLRGTVKSEEVRQGLIEKASRLPGVIGVIDHLEVKPDTAPAPAQPGPAPAADVPPPPAPEVPPAPPQEAPAAPAMPPPASESLGSRVRENLRRSPSLANLPIRAQDQNGTITLEGNVPTILDALHAFRAVQQTPGVREVVDHLVFAVPEAGKPNPLIAQGRPEDVEPYLEAQFRRHLGAEAHVDRVRVTGDLVEIRGTVADAEAHKRVLAILRTLPILRGYRVDATFVSLGSP